MSQAAMTRGNIGDGFHLRPVLTARLATPFTIGCWLACAASAVATGQTVFLSHTNTAASQGYYRATVQH